jgi:hypothetical protein
MIKTVELVREVLAEEAATRNSDHLLYYWVCAFLLKIKGIDIEDTDFGDIFITPNEYGLPQFETVSKARRKLQHDFPELVGSVEVSMHRAMNEDSFKEFAVE